MKRRITSVRSKSSVRRAAEGAALMLETLELRRMLSYDAALSVTPAGLGTGSHFGSSVATNGNLALVGAPTDGSGAGAAYLLDLSDPQNPVTTEIANPAAIPQGGDQFGAAVTFVGDDLAITAPEAREAGVPKMYVIDTDTNAVQTLVSPFADAESQSFGATIASIGSDVYVSIATPPGSPGQVAIARYETGAGTDAAADDVYFIDSNIFGQVGMAMKDGKLLASGTLDGIATVFEIDSADDSVTPKFTAPLEEATGQDPAFGFAIAATADSVLVSAPLTSRVYEFTDGEGDSGTLFAASPSASPGDFIAFGFSIAVNQAAGTVVIGDRDASVSTGSEGEAYAYALADGEFLGTLQSGNPVAAEDFGHAVAALPDGAFIVTDALEDSDGTANAGAAYVFAEVETNQPPVADAGADQTVAENTIVALDAGGSTDDAGIALYEWDFNYDGLTFNTDASGVTTNFTNDTPGTFTVAVRVTDGEGEESIDTATISFTNVAPTAEAGANQAAVVNQTVNFAGSGGNTAGDAIVGYAWDFTNDGIYDAAGANASFAYTAPGTYTVKLRVTDDDGETATDTLTVTVTQSAIVGGTLYVGGGAGNDSINVTKPGNAGTSVTINGVAVPNYTGGRVVIFGGNGADNITVSPSANVAVEVHGGAGNDTINGGSLDDILVGDGGNDQIFGGNGRDIAIGGVGADSLYGEVNDDVLIPASTAIDNNSVALAAALNAWVTSHSVAAFSGVGVITADGDVDVLSGKQGSDTFFFGTEDILIDLKKDDEAFLII